MKNVVEEKIKVGKSRLFTLFLIMGVVILVLASSKNLLKVYSHSQAPNAEAPTSGVIKINDTEFRGVVCLDPTKEIVGSLRTDDVWWQIMLDDNTNRVYTLYPANWHDANGTTNKTMDTAPAQIVKWRILPMNPRQKVTEGVVAWTFRPRSSR